jgi:hypothetical protein
MGREKEEEKLNNLNLDQSLQLRSCNVIHMPRRALLEKEKKAREILKQANRTP